MHAIALSVLLPALVLAAPADPFAGLAFLVGEWTAVAGGGKPGEAVRGGFSLERDLGGAVLVRRNRAEYAPLPGQARGAAHDDLMVVYPEGGGLRAVYFDNEGHVIRYAVTAEAGRVTFESEPGPGPRFRLVYQRQGEDEVSIAFLVAPPGKDFRAYVTGSARRRARAGATGARPD
jgi:hypothetical protein